MKIGILQTGHAPDELRPMVGDYADLFQRMLGSAGFEFVVYDVVDMQFPATVSQCDGWLITGSKHGVYEDHAFIPPLMDFIRSVYATDLPLVGVCFGHQIIAQALGGQVVKFAGGWSVGRQSYDFGGTPVALNAWHQDQVIVAPPGATTVASNDFCAHAALVYGNRAFSVQAHPEFDSTVIAGLARHRGAGLVPDAQLAAVQADLDKPVDNAHLAAQIVSFFKERRV